MAIAFAVRTATQQTLARHTYRLRAFVCPYVMLGIFCFLGQDMPLMAQENSQNNLRLPARCQGGNRVPRKLSLTFAGVYLHHIKFAKNAQATLDNTAVSGSYLYQVGGLCHGARAWIGIYSAYLHMSTHKAKALQYGLNIQHEVKLSQTVTLLLRYGLGTVQLWVSDFSGRVIGHQTELSGGVEVPFLNPYPLQMLISYRFQMIPTLMNSDKTYSFNSLALSFGTTFSM